MIEFLSELGWINGSEDDPPLILLNESNLSLAELSGADLRGAYRFAVTYCDTTMPDGSINNRHCK